MERDEAIEWVLSICPWMTYEEAREAYGIYRMYRDEGQSHEVSKQYAGLL